MRFFEGHPYVSEVSSMYILKASTLFFIIIALHGCDSCYETRDEAWEACNSKYNGKCRYLGKQYQVCAATEPSLFDRLRTVPCTTDADCDEKNPHLSKYNSY